MDYRKANPVSLTRKTMFRLIDDFRGRVPSISYSGGGDPLMNPATVDVIEHCGSWLAQVLITNGTGWKTLWDVKRLASNCRVIRISMDAATKKTYAKVRGSKLYDKALSFIEHAVQWRSPKTEISASFMLSPFNYKETVKATKLFKSMGVNRVTLKLVHSDFHDVTTKRVGFSTPDFLKKKGDTIKELIREAMCEQTKDFHVHFRHPGEFEQMSVTHQKDLYRRCYLTPLINAGIAADGNLYICCDRRGELIIGNIEKNGFWDLWGSPRHKQLIDSIKLVDCPGRCRPTEMNIIVERAFINEEMMWGLL